MSDLPTVRSRGRAGAWGPDQEVVPELPSQHCASLALSTQLCWCLCPGRSLQLHGLTEVPLDSDVCPSPGAGLVARRLVLRKHGLRSVDKVT